MNENSSAPSPATTVDPLEVEKFSAMAAQWWDPKGKFATLHKFNPVRLDYIRQHAKRHFSLNDSDKRPLKGLNLLDIGCGGGLLCEPMARLGANVTGIDPSQNNIEAASAHANEQGLEIAYLSMTGEALGEQERQYDIVLNMEVVEHVGDVDLFMRTAAGLVKPGGIMFTATLNRTLKSFGLAIIGAEYVLGWLPRGTHKWEKFVTPDELESMIGKAGMVVCDKSGVVYNPFTCAWRRSANTDVNYMVLAEKPATIGK